MQKYLFHMTLVGFFLMLVSIMGVVAFVAYRRDSGFAGIDMVKVQKIRQEIAQQRQENKTTHP